METQYKLLHDQFMSLVQNIPSAIYQCLLDEHWTIVFMSDHIYELCGYPLSDFIDNSVRSYASIIHPDDVEMVNRTVHEAVEQHKPFTIEYRIIHANGKIRYVYERGQATFYEDQVSHLDGVITDITEKVLRDKEIELLAFYDPLTRLPNRRLLMDRINLVQLEYQRNKHFAALMFMDLDSFKELNDTFGHDYGDVLLMQVADRLSSIIRKGDTVARLGGDEFIIVLKDLSDCLDDAMTEVINIADKVMSTLNTPYVLKSIEYRCTPSIGITFIHGKEFDQDELIKQADHAMYDAKKAGRNTYRFFNR
jgi:diguanylate cyclase (GGDEF)-like protein/PAS domain S-box-containing protein